MNAVVKCPNCGLVGYEGNFGTAIRPGKSSKRELWVVDAGYKCPGCRCEFGFADQD